MSAKQKCQKCGREGKRGFLTIPTHRKIVGRRLYTVPPMTQCANQHACVKRRKKLLREGEVVDDGN